MRVHGTYRYPAGAAPAGLGLCGRAFRPAPVRFRGWAGARDPLARLRPDRLPARKGRGMPVSKVITVMVGVTITIKLDASMAAGLLPGSVGRSPVRADQRYVARPGGLARGFRHSRLAGSVRSARFPGRAGPPRVAG